VPLYLADTSAWLRSGQVFQRWSELVSRAEIATCDPVSLELLYSARGAADLRALRDHLRGLPQLPLDESCSTVAGDTQETLAGRGQHRGPTPVDLLTAAVAEVHGATLLHYDRHFELIARATGQDAEWVAPPGSLGSRTAFPPKNMPARGGGGRNAASENAVLESLPPP